jgi:hypothetical protein
VLVGDELVLLQRGNRSDKRAALIHIDKGDLQRALATRRFEVTRAPRIVDLDLGMSDDLPWTCTDLALTDDGDLLASAVLEDTERRLRGRRLPGLRAGAPGARRRAALASTAGYAGEGGRRRGRRRRRVARQRCDDRTVPSQLLRASLPEMGPE